MEYGYVDALKQTILLTKCSISLFWMANMTLSKYGTRALTYNNCKLQIAHKEVWPIWQI